MEDYIRRKDALELAKRYSNDPVLVNSIEYLPRIAVVSESDYKNCKNELCYKCGEYKNRHLGGCDGCRYKE